MMFLAIYIILGFISFIICTLIVNSNRDLTVTALVAVFVFNIVIWPIFLLAAVASWLEDVGTKIVVLPKGAVSDWFRKAPAQSE